MSSSSSEFVFVTGATGFIGLQVLQKTLQAGHRARAAIRNAAGEQKIKAALASTGMDASLYSSSDKLSFVVVPDIQSPSAYDHALEDVNSVIHLASPVLVESTDFQKSHIEPAVWGTKNILQAALKHGNIRRIVITSSIVTMVDVPTLDPKRTYSEKDKATTKSLDNPFFAYITSKIMAQEAVHEFVAENPKSAGKRSFDIVTIHPTFVMGHNYAQSEYSDPIPGTNSLIWSVVAPAKDAAPLDPIPQTTVSVIDVAEAHVKGLTVPVTEDKVDEYLVAVPSGVDFTKIKQLAEEDNDEGVKAAIKDFVYKTKPEIPCHVDVSKAETKLGIKWRSFDDQVRDIIRQQSKLYKASQN